MKIKPVAHRILVKPVVAVEEDDFFKQAQAAGIIIAKDVAAREQTAIDKGHVVEWGPVAFVDFKCDVPFVAGDLVVYAKYAGKAVKDGDTEYLLLNDEDIIGVIYE